MASALTGLKVIEIGHVVAAPFCGTLLADFGAEVIKIEAPGKGDMLRGMGEYEDLWFAVDDRGKKTITLDLKAEKGKELFRALLKQADVLIENFRPGALDRLGFDWEALHGWNPRLILVSVSGYGQTGPYRKKPGFDRLGMAMGGLTYLTGSPDSTPLRPGLAIADYMAGLFAFCGTMCALYYRDHGKDIGQRVDSSLYEGILRIMESVLAEYSYKGIIRERVGNIHVSTIPGGHYLTKDKKYIALAVGGDKIFAAFAQAIGRPEMAADERYATVEMRKQNRAEIEEIAAQWISEHDLEECLDTFGERVPNGRIYSVRDIFEDPHVKARDSIVTVQTEKFGPISMQGIVPKLSETPGEVRWAGGGAGQFNDEIYLQQLGLRPEEYQRCKDEHII